MSQYKLQFTPVELISSMYRLFQPSPIPQLSPTHRLSQVLSNFLPDGETELKQRRSVRISKDHQKVWHSYITPCSRVLDKLNNCSPAQQTPSLLLHRTTVHNKPPPDFILCQLKPGHIIPHFPVISSSILYLRGPVLTSLQCLRVKTPTQLQIVTLSTHSTPTVLSCEDYKPQGSL